MTFETNNGSVDANEKNSYFIDPYGRNTNIDNIRMNHFRDARIYDSNSGSGWEIDPKIARLEYSRWIRAMRRNHQWKGFHREEWCNNHVNTGTRMWKLISTGEPSDRATPSQWEWELSGTS
jgi:hypothetical protein